MKKVIVLLSVLLLFSFGFAATGWYDDYLLINGEGAEEYYYWIGSDPSYGTQFQSHDFGSVTSLVIKGCDLKYWSDTQDRTGGSFWWRIGTGTATEEIWNHAAIGGNNYQGTLSGLSIDVCDGLADGQSYELQIWAKSWGTGQGDSYLSNGGANYVATFTIPEEQVPITLASFTAEALKGKVVINWTTETETENSHFLVYRNGAVIRQVAGHGTCTDPHDYTFVDVLVKPGVHAYAISDVTYGGEEVLHEAVSIEVSANVAEADFVLNKAYPNPFNPTTVISMHYAVGSNAVVNIYNTQGVLVEELVNDFVEAGNYELTWDATNMPSGVYVVTMHAGNTVQSQKIVLMK
ncbi:MAG: T9SS type A sorting domain-containing protein [Candidatus Marinimicrobia bacterium]|nr:T9SS type A sorting domain-containing protein [Candidatus Neomarinimicrobiota bacterium]